MYYIGIDCGGTHMRVGIVNENGEILAKSYIDSPLKTNTDIFGDTAKTEIDKLCSQLNISLDDIKAIGISTPGPIDEENGQILKSSNLHNEEPIKIIEQMRKHFSMPMFLDHDAKMALLGEVWKGAAVDANPVVLITLGTGMGGAVKIDDKLIIGEIGHIFLQVPDLLDVSTSKDSPTCGLGHRGCFEALMKSANDLDKISYYLGYELANIVDIFNPQKIIIGGGMTKRGDFLPKAVEIMKEKGVFPFVDEVTVEYAKFVDFAGVVGAAKRAMDS